MHLAIVGSLAAQKDPRQESCSLEAVRLPVHRRQADGHPREA